jgi:hypothetical protein
MRIVSSLLCAVIVAIFCLGILTPAWAACLAGVPCIEPLPDDSQKNPPNAQKTASPACDSEFMNQIYAVSSLNAGREQIIDQIVLRKPDSVLQYSCFDQLAGRANAIAGKIFSENPVNTSLPIGDVIGNSTIAEHPLNVPAPDTLKASLTNTVLGPFISYLTANFDHPLLGGAGISPPPIQAEINNDPLQFNCNTMNEVQLLARCENFATDWRFFDFAWLTSNDPRLLPKQCTQGTNLTTQLVDLAKNANFAYVPADRLTTYLSQTTNAPDKNSCGTPIKTGIIISPSVKEYDPGAGRMIVKKTTSFPDMVCPNPNCYYNPEDQKCVL